ncbi:MAG: DUF937 domain-containing protein [Alphaproteobacteria bacterium]|nr:DUF937 domain-containing protein [Alphaproteobacteria bacterium]
MGLLDILGSSGNQRSGISPLMLALMGVLAYRTFRGQGRLADMLGRNHPDLTSSGNTQNPGMGPLAGILSGAGLGSGGLGGLLAGGGLGAILSGGLGDLLKRFQSNGHGETASSWIESGPNKAIGPAQLEEALGPERVQWLLEQTGMSKQDLMSGLSAKLPEVVDQLTPQGRLPSPDEAEKMV